ncbi:hypothetical protein ASPZODRAFT_72838 [Penicilliopsis zonata CBS 506.65]|uniref:Ubiquitin carboxyl-terminal hydrolase n=1 Tax=Penicilliopsis zonata CBS 506.65 TaxID=1073090 RepID=A0A1L9SAL6_9EURO|nr:hypothetical protein ASPZODRAFT_72838 [Penicilliopsis zonata CBS 506.65]OJJ44149.1 hypothetical protein ASPZODRAFT_72838 [Penicilliopsis zonata CBS 506.65]
MMNHHLPAMPHGQQPMPPQRRQHEMPYAAGPPNMRPPPAYMPYSPHMNGHPPPTYSPQQYGHWYPVYTQMQLPPRPYQQSPYAPLIVSSYPPSQPVIPAAHVPPPSMLQPRTATPHQLPMSPAASAVPSQLEMQTPSPAAAPVNDSVNSPVLSPSFSTNVKLAPTAPEPFRAPVPWLSVPECPFPARVPRRRRRGRINPASAFSVELPAKDTPLPSDQTELIDAVKTSESLVPQAPSEPQTPTTSAVPSEADSTHPTTPSSTAPQSSVRTQSKGSKPAVPLVPIVPIIPQIADIPRQPAKDGADSTKTEENHLSTSAADAFADSTKPASSAPAVSAVSKSWADLVRSKAASRAAAASGTESTESRGLAVPKSETLADVLMTMGDDVSQYAEKVAFLEPRGLVNTGNMCYMNSVLQILVSCVPFHQFLDYIGRRAAHSFQSDLPLIDAMIMFVREFRVIDAARSEEQLKLRLKPNELEEYGDAFTPEFVYEVIRQLPRFRDMRRGHQQDAQEFLGFLLEEMHEECVRASKHTSVTRPDDSIDATNQSGDGWLEVGHKQKAAITRSSGHIALESPITRIFGGKIRSEFKVPGNKNSVTLEPYQSLQLDIGSPDVHNIIDALKGLTKSESIQGDFNSSRGPNVTATKQIFIESLPPVLILHLKRFQYDSVTRGTQKIWKKIGYPLDLEIPREVLPPHRRNLMTPQGGLPKYRLVGVIYHHGKNASVGHYTVDVRRQDGREWIRMDDTMIRRIRSEEVAEAGGEEDPKVLAAALEQHKRDKEPYSNIFDHIDQNDLEDSDGDRGWSQVNGSGTAGHSSKKSVSTGVNGVSTSTVSGSSSGVRTPIGRYGTRDNKVAYLLFYQRIA